MILFQSHKNPDLYPSFVELNRLVMYCCWPLLLNRIISISISGLVQRSEVKRFPLSGGRAQPAKVGRYLLWQPCHGHLWHPASPGSFTKAGLWPFRKHVSFILTDHCVRFLCPANKDSSLYTIIYLNAHTHTLNLKNGFKLETLALFTGNRPLAQWSVKIITWWKFLLNKNNVCV